MVQITFEYLLAVPEPKPTEETPSRPTALARRRRSQSLLATLAKGQEKPHPDLFNLDDLILGSLRSPNQQTVTATLRLISTMLRTHHQYDVSLIKMGPPEISASVRPFHVHERNTARLFSIVEDLMDDGPSLAESYDLHLEDAQTLLETHACSMQLLALPNDDICPHDTKTGQPNNKTSTVSPADHVLGNLVSILQDFLTNEIETNLSLTQVFSTIASCARTSLDGWLIDNNNAAVLNAPFDYVIGDDITSSDEATTVAPNQKSDGKTNTRVPSPNNISEMDGHCMGTPIFAAIESLVKQVETFRQDIHNFDIYLSERRHVFNVGQEIDNATRNESPVKRISEDSDISTRLLTKSGLPIGSISERLMSETSTAVGSRSSSPRGRQLDAPPLSTLAGRLSRLRLSASRSPSKSAPRAMSPSHLRNDTPSILPPKRVATPMGPPDALRQKVRVKTYRAGGRDMLNIRSETSSVRSESTTEAPSVDQYREVTLSHVLTNVIILQEFVLELAAIVQVRASLFGEVSFDT